MLNKFYLNEKLYIFSLVVTNKLFMKLFLIIAFLAVELNYSHAFRT